MLCTFELHACRVVEVYMPLVTGESALEKYSRGGRWVSKNG
jgi:hypothetical protein